MPIIRKYYPSFFDGFEEAEVEFNSLEELLAIPWIKSRSEGTAFHQFSVSCGDTLMAEYDNGDSWWVVGMFHPNEITKQLPIFNPSKK